MDLGRATCLRVIRVMKKSKQLTLFQCREKRPKLQHDNSSTKPTMEEELEAGESSESHDDDGKDASLKWLQGNQAERTNYITVDRLHGSTTIVVNASSSVSCPTAIHEAQQPPLTWPESNQQQQQQPPSDISSSTLQPPVQPRINFPARCFAQGRPRAFNPECYKNFKWLEYSINSRDGTI